MSAGTAQRIDARGLRDTGRSPETPFCVVLADGREVLLRKLLRVLPGKRIVAEGDWGGRPVLAKFFVAEGSARHWAQEKAGIVALHQAKLPTPDLLLAEALPGGGHVLLTVFVDGAQSLADAWQPLSESPVGSPQALSVLLPAFLMVGKMHAAGLVQNDLHLGNFLRTGDELFVIDGDAVRSVSPGKALESRRATNNLAVLFAQLPLAWDSQRDALIEAYLAGGGCRISDMAGLQYEVSRVRTLRLKDYLGKTVRDCTLFSVKRSALRFVALRREEAERLSSLLDAPDDAVRGGQLLKDGRTCTVARATLDERVLVVKRYNLKNARHLLARFWRPSRAWHSWREGHRLGFLGIPTPAPLALLEERVGPLRRRAFLINEFCPGPSLLDYLAPDREPEAEIGRAIVSLFRILCDNRISHGDLKATNLLWHDGKVFVIDLDAVLQHRSSSAFARAWQRDRARLLRNWPATSALCQWLDRHLPTA